MKSETYLAHTVNADDDHPARQQLLCDHLRESADLAQKAGQAFGLPTACYLAGLLHDAGKYTAEFQDYLIRATNGDPTVHRGQVTHSTAGAWLIWQLGQSDPDQLQKVSELIANAIMSHHARSPKDFIDPLTPASPTSFPERLLLTSENNPAEERAELESVAQRVYDNICSRNALLDLLKTAAHELVLATEDAADQDIYFQQMVIFSALIDADRTNTMLFEMDKTKIGPDNKAVLRQVQAAFENHLTVLQHGSESKTPINQLRAHLSQESVDFATKPTGIYRLCIPTGGGKTFCSMRFALEHARLNHKDKVIFIEPYTTIIEQNAQVFRDILTQSEQPELADLVVEHHSNLVPDEKSADGESDNQTNADIIAAQARAERTQLIRDNWSGPILFTTSVAFLNAIFGSGTKNTRHFHNLANAVIIFDEIQALPVKTLQLFTAAINYLVNYANTTSVLCTATQPALDELPNTPDFNQTPEIIPDYREMEPQFTRVTIHDQSRMGNDYETTDIADFVDDLLTGTATLAAHNNVLVILNTKRSVQSVFVELKERHPDSANTLIYHLSTNMCPQHRLDLLNGTKKPDIATTNSGDDETNSLQPDSIGIKEKLKSNPKGQKIIVVTTPLIEAGVDISFEAVVRSMIGIASIVQAAGRCNRNGEKTQGDVYLINPSDKLEHITEQQMPELGCGRTVAASLLRAKVAKRGKSPNVLLTTDFQHLFFERFYRRLSKKTDKNYTAYRVKDSTHNLFGLLANRESFQPPLKVMLKDTICPQYIANNFEMIDTFATDSIIIPYNSEAQAIISTLIGENRPDYETLRNLLQRVQRYTVKVSPYILKSLVDNKQALPIIDFNLFYLSAAIKNYDADYGLKLDATELNDFIF